MEEFIGGFYTHYLALFANLTHFLFIHLNGIRKLAQYLASLIDSID